MTSLFHRAAPWKLVLSASAPIQRFVLLNADTFVFFDRDEIPMIRFLEVRQTMLIAHNKFIASVQFDPSKADHIKQFLFLMGFRLLKQNTYVRLELCKYMIRAGSEYKLNLHNERVLRNCFEPAKLQKLGFIIMGASI